MAVGLDLDERSLIENGAMPFRVRASSGQLPFADGVFDLIAANMFVEHLQVPVATLNEVCRVLKPGGVFLFHTPNILNPITLMAVPLSKQLRNRIVWLLDNRAEQDVFPAFYRLNCAKTIRRMALRTGITVDQFDLLESSPETVMLGPLVIFEMLFIRLTRLARLRGLRSNIVAVLRKPDLTAISPAIGTSRTPSPNKIGLSEWEANKAA